MSSAIRDAILDHFTSVGVPAHVAAGIVGNLAVESRNFDAKVISGEVRGDNGKAAYVGQWRGNRLDNLMSYAAAKGEKTPSLKTQLDFIALEMTPGHKFSDPIAAKARDTIFSAPTAEKAAALFSQHYERPGTPHLSNRETAAKAAYQGYFESKTANAPTPTSRADALRDAILDQTPTASVTAAAQPAVASSASAPAAGLASARDGFISPLGVYGDRVVSNFGFRDAPMTPSGRGSALHKGTDITASMGRGVSGVPVQTIGAGVVTGAGTSQGYGNFVTVQHDNGYTSRYAHLQNINPSMTVGTRVAAGTPIGLLGSTGKSQAPHLHLEVRNPQGVPVDARSMVALNPNPSVPTPTSRNDVLASTPHSGTPARAAQEASMAALAQQQAQMAQAAAPAPHAGPSARSAQEASMAALQQQQAPAVASAYVGPSARSAQEASMAALAQSQAPATINVASAAPVQASASSLPGFGLTAAPQAATAPAFAQTSTAPAARAQDVFNIDAATIDGRINQAHSLTAPSLSSVADSRVAQAHAIGAVPLSDLADGRVAQAHAVGAPSARAAQEMSMAALNAFGIDSTPTQAMTQAAKSPIQQSVPSLNPTPAVAAPVGPSFGSTPAIGPAPNSRPDTIASAIVNNAVSPSAGSYAPLSSYAPSSSSASIGGTGRGGLFSDTGLFSPANVQNAVVGGLGGLAGGVIGGAALGPLGGLIGSALGRHVAQQQFGVTAPPTQNVIAMNHAHALQLMNQGVPSASIFPAAPPPTGQEWSGWASQGDRDHAMSISPAATEAIESGRGGLY